MNPREPSVSGWPSDLVFLERGWLSSNSLLCLASDGCGLIDSGHTVHANQLAELIQGQVDTGALTSLHNTHLHSDHCGGNARVLSQSCARACQTWVPSVQFSAVQAWDESELGYAETGQLCERFSALHGFAPGDVVRSGGRHWEVHAAGGHDPHAVMFFNPDTRTLVSGDALWPTSFAVVFPELLQRPGFGDALETLDRIEELAPCWVVPGHGPLISDTAAAMEGARARLRGWQLDPTQHARHAALVLIKYHLMEVGREPLAAFYAWAQRATLLQRIHGIWFDSDFWQSWLNSGLTTLTRKGVIKQESGFLMDV